MERANETQTSTAQAAASAPPQATSAAGIVQAIVASGKREASEIAEIVKAHPTIAKDIIQVLQWTMGNAFVQAVLKYAGASFAPEAKPADNAAPANAPVANAPAANAPATPNENAPMPLGPARVTASLLNVRRTASTAKSDNIVGELQHGQVVTTTGQQGEWFQIEYEGKPAFIYSHYVTPADAKATAVSSTASTNAPAAVNSTNHAAAAPAPVATAGADHEKHTTPAEHQPAANNAKAAGPATAQAGKPGEPTTVGNGKESKAMTHGKGYVRYGGGTVKNALVQLVQAGKLKLTGAQIAQLDAIAQVETGGQIGCVQTYDNQVVSMGFKQVVLGYGSLEKVMMKAPGGFAKHGLSIDTSAQYTDVAGGQPNKIAGAPDSAMLRTPEWGDKFFHASLESDVIAALCDLVLLDAKKVDTAIQKDAGGIANFDDPTARAWLLEMYNNRPAYVPYAVRRAAEAGAGSAANRNEFLDILANAIVKVYEELEPEFAYRSKVKKHPEYTDAQRTALKHQLDAELGPGAAQKGKNIVTKISRNLEIPKVNETETVKQSTPAATPPTTTVIDQHVQQPLPESHEDAKSSPPPVQADASKAAEHPEAPKPKKPADQPVATAPTATATAPTATAATAASAATATPATTSTIAAATAPTTTVAPTAAAPTHAPVAAPAAPAHTAAAPAPAPAPKAEEHPATPAQTPAVAQTAPVKPAVAKPPPTTATASVSPAATHAAQAGPATTQTQPTDVASTPVSAGAAIHALDAIKAPTFAGAHDNTFEIDGLTTWLDQLDHALSATTTATGAGPDLASAVDRCLGAHIGELQKTAATMRQTVVDLANASTVATGDPKQAVFPTQAAAKALSVTAGRVDALANASVPGMASHAAALQTAIAVVEDGSLALLQALAVSKARDRWKTGTSTEADKDKVGSKGPRTEIDNIFRDAGWEDRIAADENGRIYDWCGIFVVSSYFAGAGMASQLRQGFYHVDNVKDFFHYQQIHNDARVPMSIWADGQWWSLPDYHKQRGSVRQWTPRESLAAAQKAGTPLDIRPGDTCLIDHSGGDKPVHIVMVESYDAATGKLITIEGNTFGTHVAKDGGAEMADDTHMKRSTQGNGTAAGLNQRDMTTLAPTKKYRVKEEAEVREDPTKKPDDQASKKTLAAGTEVAVVPTDKKQTVEGTFVHIKDVGWVMLKQLEEVAAAKAPAGAAHVAQGATVWGVGRPSAVDFEDNHGYAVHAVPAAMKNMSPDDIKKLAKKGDAGAKKVQVK